MIRKGFTPLEKNWSINVASLDSEHRTGRVRSKFFNKVRKYPLTGFTLIEVIVSMAILGVLILGAVAVLNVGDMTWRSDMALLELQQDVRLAMDGMAREIRQSESSEIDICSGSDMEFSIYDLSGTQYSIDYSLDSSNKIIREHPAGTYKTLARNIDSLNFSCSGDVVTVQINAAKTGGRRALNFSLKEKVRLRN